MAAFSTRPRGREAALVLGSQERLVGRRRWWQQSLETEITLPPGL